jgi:hypothetical protein
MMTYTANGHSFSQAWHDSPVTVTPAAAGVQCDAWRPYWMPPGENRDHTGITEQKV